MSDGDAKRTTGDGTSDDVNPSSGAGGDGHPIIAQPPPPVTTDSDKNVPTELIAVSPREPAVSDEGLGADNMSDGDVKRTTGDGTPDDVNPSSGAGGEGHPIIAQPPPPDAAVIARPPPPDAAVPGTPVPNATESPEVDRVPTEAEALQILEARHRAFSAQVSIISRSPEPDLEGLRRFLGGVSMARVATFVAHAQATDPSMFGSSDSTVLPQDPDAMFTLNCAVMCHSVLWASEDAVLAGRGEWTRGKVIGTFDDGSMDILHEGIGPDGSMLERVHNRDYLRVIPVEEAATAGPTDTPLQVGAPPAPQAPSPTPDTPPPDDPARLTAALNMYAKPEDPMDLGQLRDLFSRAVGALHARSASDPTFKGNTTVPWLLDHIQDSGGRRDEPAKKIIRAAIVHVSESLRSAAQPIKDGQGR